MIHPTWIGGQAFPGQGKELLAFGVLGRLNGG